MTMQTFLISLSLLAVVLTFYCVYLNQRLRAHSAEIEKLRERLKVLIEVQPIRYALKMQASEETPPPGTVDYSRITATCTNCGPFFKGESLDGATEILARHRWGVIDGKLYCGSCRERMEYEDELNRRRKN